ELIAAGHASIEVWDYTPRRIASFLKLAHRRLGREAAQALSISALAARGDANEIRRQHKELTRE
ncbi:MAG: hypothetical protein CFE32_22570, partial [Alphaproteobacteria bacterium PA3]